MALIASIIALLSSTADGFARNRGMFLIVVSKAQQSLVVYDGDTVVATSAVSTGKAGHETPTGIFSILEKRRRHASNIYSNSPMPFMQRLTWSGIALHGSKHVPSYPASHGCVRLPDGFAAALYKMTKPGAHVLISDRQISPSEVEGAVLFRKPRTSVQQVIGKVEGAPVEVAMVESMVPGVAKQMTSVHEPIRILITRHEARDTVREVQVALRLLGYGPGALDGYAGPATVAALRVFQVREGLESDGKLTPALSAMILLKAGRTPPSNGKILVRQGFRPLFEAFATIERPQEALGTHFLQFRLHGQESVGGKWFGVSLQNDLLASTKKGLGILSEADPAAFDGIQRTLSRITVSNDIRERIESLLSEGSSLSIADADDGLETGQGTDFITLTRSRSED
ncbi:L,D-transpeptidase family protein [Ensifer sp. SL37]|uniref:L,D-transpeptidase family protein n=1 Tax=Ensifer sp. SL37 TaxID=2995137 RepID=UPI002276A61D|nr:L,D-transpeptidase family protein [Ensifer sp. SL37]MCY1740507.1 L,D-transpeptidase family protein [Ensifer sp. SL37]